mmetsp:Transcript_31078/g.34386  ORF Transcript_31078/g.34386 Transcript_31078/m.34386 type:complete len:377 (-) Transcript_31078:81-1211(-)
MSSDDDENANYHISSLIEESREKWKSMNDKLVDVPPPATIQVAFIADQDQNSILENGAGFYSTFATAKLYRHSGGKKYTFDYKKVEDLLYTKEGSKKGRGAEYSLLEPYGNKILTACDKTGNLDEVIPHPDATSDGSPKYALQPVVEGDQLGRKRLVVLHGDGTSNPQKGLKCEWSSQYRDGSVYIGSTGKEQTHKDGTTDGGAMWVKSIHSNTWKITNIDWTDKYNALRKAVQCYHTDGYIHHESARYSSVHNKWFFLPRKLSRLPFNFRKDDTKCINLMLAISYTNSEVIAKPILEYDPLRGCADFFFLPDTNDTHIFVLRTVETQDEHIYSYASVIDLEGTILMEEFRFAKGRKFEGTCMLKYDVIKEEAVWC